MAPAVAFFVRFRFLRAIRSTSPTHREAGEIRVRRFSGFASRDANFVVNFTRQAVCEIQAICNEAVRDFGHVPTPRTMNAHPEIKAGYDDGYDAADPNRSASGLCRVFDFGRFRDRTCGRAAEACVRSVDERDGRRAGSAHDGCP